MGRNLPRSVGLPLVGTSRGNLYAEGSDRRARDAAGLDLGRFLGWLVRDSGPITARVHGRGVAPVPAIRGRLAQGGLSDESLVRSR
jgi:hypothetical protein